jgi:hypothetical protein
MSLEVYHNLLSYVSSYLECSGEVEDIQKIINQIQAYCVFYLDMP